MMHGVDSCCCRTYDAATADSVTHDLGTANDYAAAAAAGDDDDNGCYQLPLPVEQIFWVDNCDSFHSSVNHIAQVYNVCLTMLCLCCIHVLVIVVFDK